jgi:hypothetical protein
MSNPSWHYRYQGNGSWCAPWGAYEFEIRAETLGDISDTTIVGQVVYFGGTLFIADETFTLTSHNIATYTVIPVIGIDIFAGFTSV